MSGSVVRLKRQGWVGLTQELREPGAGQKLLVPSVGLNAAPNPETYCGGSLDVCILRNVTH